MKELEVIADKTFMFQGLNVKERVKLDYDKNFWLLLCIKFLSLYLA